jgi:hypothetical protein
MYFTLSKAHYMLDPIILFQYVLRLEQSIFRLRLLRNKRNFQIVLLYQNNEIFSKVIGNERIILLSIKLLAIYNMLIAGVRSKDFIYISYAN